MPTVPGQHQDAPHELARGHEEEAQAQKEEEMKLVKVESELALQSVKAEK